MRSETYVFSVQIHVSDFFFLKNELSLVVYETSEMMTNAHHKPAWPKVLSFSLVRNQKEKDSCIMVLKQNGLFV